MVLAGQTDGDFTGTNSYEGATDFAVVKLTADGETEWTWQVTERDGLCTICSNTCCHRLFFRVPETTMTMMAMALTTAGRNSWRVRSLPPIFRATSWVIACAHDTSCLFSWADPWADAQTLGYLGLLAVHAMHMFSPCFVILSGRALIGTQQL